MISLAVGTALALIRWALTRWQTKHLLVTGYASTHREAPSFNNLELARRCAAAATLLQQAGFTTTQRVDYPVDHQITLERDQGILAFQVAQVSIEADQGEANTKVP